MPTFRVLVTGGRNRSDEQTVWDHLTALLAAGVDLTVVHGNCPQGVDAYADRWCRTAIRATSRYRVTVEHHPADWSLGKRAGMVRNAAMVKLGADLVLAYPDPRSVGTYGCVDLAVRAGLPVTIHRLPSDPPKRIQLRRTDGWRKPPAAVVVSRPSRWGNPFAHGTSHALARVPALDGSEWEYEGRISADGMRHDYHHPDGRITEHHIRYMTVAECVEMFRRALCEPTPQIRLWDRKARTALTVDDVRRELAGRDLACWCPLDGPCHGDVLLAAANAVPTACGGWL